MPKDTLPPDQKKDHNAANCPYLLTRAQRIRRKRQKRDGWEPADLALARERHSRGARLRSRNRDEAGTADNPAVALVVAVADIDEENVEEPREEAPQPDMAAAFAIAVPLDPDEIQDAPAESQAEHAEAVPAEGQASSAAEVDKDAVESSSSTAEEADNKIHPSPAESVEINAQDVVTLAVIETNTAEDIPLPAVDSASTTQSTETKAANNTEPTVDGIATAGTTMGDTSAESMINTTSIELDFGGISAPAADACSSVNESSIDTSTMDSDAESI